jgi:hypothetical protein
VRLVVERFVGVPGQGSVMLVNDSRDQVRVWRTGSQWGDVLLSFSGHRARAKVHIVRRPQLYTVNVRSAVVVPTRARYKWPFDFTDGTWEPEIPFDEWVGPGTTLTAVYRVDADPDALAYGVLIGTLESKPVAWRKR